MNDLDPAEFRQEFPEFADPTQFPDALIRRHHLSANTIFARNAETTNLLSPDVQRLIISLLTGHLIKLEAELLDADTDSGITVSASVGSVSVSLAPPPFGGDQWRYWLNLTGYGSQALALMEAQMVGGFFVPSTAERY